MIYYCYWKWISKHVESRIHSQHSTQGFKKGGTPVGQLKRLLLFSLGHPAPTITWLKEESHEDVLWIKPETPGYKLASSNMHYSLILLDVGKEYSGTYTCIATNKAGQSICTASLEVLDGKFLQYYKHFPYSIKHNIV